MNSTEDELNDLQITNQIILDSAGEGIYGLDREGRTTFVNKAATEILGWREEDILGELLHDIHHHSHADGSPYHRDVCPIYASLTDGEVHRVENEVFWHSNESAIPVEYTSTPIRNDKGKLIGAVIVFRDITKRKKIEQQREKAYEEIKQLKDKIALERDYLRDEINSSTNYGNIIGKSRALVQTLAQVEAVADTPVSVLILGESGVGKEMIAQAIHNTSQRANYPMIKVNCASIPKELFESEFFGHVRGSFTGAHKDRVGRIKLADGGTLFLDEVGEIPPEMQSKLLRVLQEHEFERVGDDRTTQVNIRIIAATNRDLETEVKKGNFREDLFYRLSVFPIRVPPLRERLDDIGMLAIQFVKHICRELGRESLTMTKQQLLLLQRHDWPGNIRELKNVIERAVIISKGNRLRLEPSMSNLISPNQENMTSLIETPEFFTESEFHEKEKANLIAVLRHTKWKISGEGGAAELLGIKASTFTYRVNLFGIKKGS